MMLAVALVAWAGTANGHSWYDVACCSGYDCHVVPTAAVTATPSGWRVRLDRGMHPFADRGIDEVVPYDDSRLRESRDGEFHACISAHSRTLLCLYVPPQGS